MSGKTTEGESEDAGDKTLEELGGKDRGSLLSFCISIIYRGKMSWPLEQEVKACNETMVGKVICSQPKLSPD